MMDWGLLRLATFCFQFLQQNLCLTHLDAEILLRYLDQSFRVLFLISAILLAESVLRVVFEFIPDIDGSFSTLFCRGRS